MFVGQCGTTNMDFVMRRTQNMLPVFDLFTAESKVNFPEIINWEIRNLVMKHLLSWPKCSSSFCSF